MGSSGKIAVGGVVAALGLMAMTIFTLDGPVLIALAGAVSVTYLASVWSVLARGRHLAMVLGAGGTACAIAFSVAFLRMWGLAFNKDAQALGHGVASRESDIYFYLAAATGLLTLAILFTAAVWPSRKVSPQRKRQRTKPRTPATQRPAAKKQAPGTPMQKNPPTRSAAGKKGVAKRPAPSRAR